MIQEVLTQLQAKPSLSEEHGLALLSDSDQVVLSAGISTGGVAEIRMVLENPRRQVIATTIDEAGAGFAQKIVKDLDLEDQIQIHIEDLRQPSPYDRATFDFIYARLVLHYLSSQDLDKALRDFYKILKPGGRLFVVVRSVKNIPKKSEVKYDKVTKLTSIPQKDAETGKTSYQVRYFHSLESITTHLQKADFVVESSSEYQEQLYQDFMRQKLSPHKDHVIEVVAQKIS